MVNKVQHGPTGDLGNWSYEYDWSYEPTKKNGRFRVMERQTVFTPERDTAIGQRDYIALDDCTERQAINYIEDQVKEYRRTNKPDGCPAACKAPWTWIDEHIAAVIERELKK
jgi:hypothetical protein